MSSGRGNRVAVNNDDRNGERDRLADGVNGLAPTTNTTTSAWTVDEGDTESEDAISLKLIRVQNDLEQNMQRGCGPVWFFKKGIFFVTGPELGLFQEVEG